MKKFKLILIISVIFLSCSDNSVENEIQENEIQENEIQENVESVVERKKYELSIISTNGGTVNISSGAYNSGTILNITATPNEGFKFTDWTGYRCIKCSWSIIPYYSDESSITEIINTNLFLTANFEPLE